MRSFRCGALGTIDALMGQRAKYEQNDVRSGPDNGDTASCLSDIATFIGG